MTRSNLRVVMHCALTLSLAACRGTEGSEKVEPPKQAEITKVAVTSARCQAAIKTWLSLARPEARSQLPEVDAARSFLGSRTAFVQCTVDDLATLLGPSVAMLDDHRLIVDHSPSDGPRIEVRRGAIEILRNLTQRSFGPLQSSGGGYANPDVHVTTLDEDRATVQAWSSWWKATSAAPTVAIAQGQRTVADALARERSAAEARLRTGTLWVIRAWKTLPYMDPLTADSAKLFDAEWGAFMARGDELFQIAVYNSGQLVKATPKGLSARFTDADYPADAALRWTYADVLPLESLVEHKAVAMPGAILDHIRDEEPELYTHLLREFHLEFTAVESNTVVRLQLRVP